MSLSVLSVASEAYPLIKTGGLGDVVGALPGAVAPHGIAMTTLLPGYPAVTSAVKRAKRVHTWGSLMGVEARLLRATHEGQPLMVLDAPALFAREGGPYSDAAGTDWSDNSRRFAIFSRAAAALAAGEVRGFAFDILHAHDWQAAMASAYLRYRPGPQWARSVVTIHNIAFQGKFEANTFATLDLPPEAWGLEGVEYFGGVGFLKAGLVTADAITTVSPTYADEIRNPQFGMGLEGLITARQDAVSGILNGIDPKVWSPAADSALAAPFTHKSLARRLTNKRAVETAFALPRAASPLFIVVSRLTWQKGMDVLLEALDGVVAAGARLAILGSGDAALEAGFTAAAARHPDHIGVNIGYDEQLSHLMQGGGDAILIPSRFEPCGLTQLYGLAYGCVPVVARTGGLSDTVIHASEAALAMEVATGIQFDGVSVDQLLRAIRQAVKLYQQPKVWRQMQRQGMKGDFSWARSGRRYAELYTQLMNGHAR